MGLLDRIFGRKKDGGSAKEEVERMKAEEYQRQIAARKIGETRTKKSIYNRYKESFFGEGGGMAGSQRLPPDAQKEIEKSSFLKKRAQELLEEKKEMEEIELSKKGETMLGGKTETEDENAGGIPPNSRIAAVVKIAQKTVGDHKNWSDRLIDEKSFTSRKEARAFASMMRAKGYYAKTVKVSGGYKVYVYAKKGSASVVLSGEWSAMKKLKTLNTKPVRGKNTGGSQFVMNQPSMGSLNSSMLNIDFNMDSELLRSFEMNSLNDLNMNFDFELGGFDLLGGGMYGSKRKKKKF